MSAPARASAARFRISSDFVIYSPAWCGAAGLTVCWGLTYHSRQHRDYRNTGRFAAIGFRLRSAAHCETWHERERRAMTAEDIDVSEAGGQLRPSLSGSGIRSSEGTMGGIAAAAIRVVLISASLFAAGCVSNRQVYPQAWPSIETPVGQACAQIANTYRDRGESAPDLNDSTPSRPASLTGVLFGDVANLRQAERVTFSFPQVGQLQLVVSGSSGQLLSVSSSPARPASFCVERASSSCARARDGTSRPHQRRAQPELSPRLSYILWTTIWSSRNRNTD